MRHSRAISAAAPSSASSGPVGPFLEQFGDTPVPSLLWSLPRPLLVPSGPFLRPLLVSSGPSWSSFASLPCRLCCGPFLGSFLSLPAPFFAEVGYPCCDRLSPRGWPSGLRPPPPPAPRNWLSRLRPPLPRLAILVATVSTSFKVGPFWLRVALFGPLLRPLLVPSGPS